MAKRRLREFKRINDEGKVIFMQKELDLVKCEISNREQSIKTAEKQIRELVMDKQDRYLCILSHNFKRFEDLYIRPFMREDKEL